MKSLKRLLLNSLLVSLAAVACPANQMSGGNYVITKDLFGATGSPSLTSQNYAMAFAWGEQISGDVIFNSTDTIISGYYGGRFGSAQTITVLSWLIGTAGAKTFFQDHIQVGVPYDAQIQITFSDQLSPLTIASGVQVLIAADHLGQSSNAVSSFTYTSDPTNHTITISPPGTWLGNTVYDIRLSQSLQNVDGFPLDQVHDIYFVTLLDQHQENVVQDPIAAAGASAALTNSPVGVMSVDIPTESLADFSAVLLSRDPINSPLHIDPKIIQDANDKARAAGGAYRVPVAVQEINAYNINGDLMGPLSKPAQLTIDYGAGFSQSGGASSGLIRPQTLALWALDPVHELWVKIPASQNAVGFHTVSAPVTNLSVFALMGSADGSATDSFAFPVPWRPHGPNAGTGLGQTGTEADGINFSNLPSECTIKIYTIAGGLVRQIEHSDTGGLIGQEKWDVRTAHGDPAASGVYLWRVESSVDGKNGKLMVIR